MHILFAGGGTAGHINPALAVAEYIKSVESDAKISYIGKKGGLEERLVPAAGIDFYPIRVEGFQRSLSLNNIKRNIIAVKLVFSASSHAKKLLRELKPDVVMGTGGYVSGPVLRAAHKLGIKTVIHEQNAFPGVTTKMLAPDVDKVMLAMIEAQKYLKLKKEPILTGNPVRQSLIYADRTAARQKLNVGDRVVVLSFGGSLGARPINQAVCEYLKNNWRDKRFHFIHATGKLGYDSFINEMKQNGVDLSAPNLDVRQYIEDMDICMAAADLVVSRSGAITVSELQVCKKPSILIPSPYVAENHQYHNAMTLVNAGAAELIQESELSAQALCETIEKVASSEKRLKDMSDAAGSIAIADANQRIYKVICDVLGR